MKMNSYEIDNLLFQKQMSLYNKIDNRINKNFDELDPDILSVLTRTLMDLDDRIQSFKKKLQNGEMFNINYNRNPREVNRLKENGIIKLKDIMKEINTMDF